MTHFTPIKDETGDTLDIAESIHNYGEQLYIVTSPRGTFLKAEEVEQVRDELTDWLRENGYEEMPVVPRPEEAPAAPIVVSLAKPKGGKA